jgi:hypothetical protein
MEGGADQGAGVGELVGGVLQRVVERDALGAGHEEAEGDGLGVAVGEALVGGLGKEELAPVLGDRGEGWALAGELLDGFFAEKAAEARSGVGERLGRVGRGGRPGEERLEHGLQARGRRELGAGGADVAVQGEQLADEFAVLPEAESIAVGEEDIGEGEQLPALVPVVRGGKAAWIGTLAGGFELDEAGESAGDGDGVVRTEAEVGESGLADGSDVLAGREGGHIEQELLEGGTDLVFGIAARGEIGELRCGGGAKARSRRFDRQVGGSHRAIVGVVRVSNHERG